MFDGKAFGEEVVGIVQDYVERAVAPLKAENEDLKARLKVLEERPAPEVLKGDPGEPGKDGADGKDGNDGADGRGVKDLLIDREGNLIATMDDGATKSLGPVCGKDGAQGKDGRDGIDLDSFEAIVLDDDRTIELKFASGDVERVASFKWPTMIYRDVFKEGAAYQQGDVVTWGGSLWHCDKATSAKPGTDDWTLACKKGRDGKDVKHG
jgi:hypothetical protein